MKFLWLTAYIAGLLWSPVNPHDYFTWFLEAAPALIGLAALVATREQFPWAPITYTLILIYCCTTSSYKVLFPEERSCVERDDRKEVYPRKQMTW